MRRSIGEEIGSINNDSFDKQEILVINDDLKENIINGYKKNKCKNK